MDILAQRTHSEYQEAMEGEEEEPTIAPITSPISIETAPPKRSSSRSHIVALRRGCVVKIIVGSNSRKAWKKRRRSGSPLLIACSIQGIDELSAIRCNIMHILHNSRANVKLLASQYRKTFGEPLRHGNFGGTVELLQQVLKNPKYKVHVVQKNGKWYVESYRHRPELSPMLEFNDEYLHTGLLADGESVSAALRISSTETVPEPGTEMFAIVWDFEPEGDAGFPLVTLSLTPPVNQQRSPVTKEKALPIGHRLRGVVSKLTRGGVFVECLPSQQRKTPMRGILKYRDARLPAEPSEYYEMKEGNDDSKRAGTIDDLFESNNEDEEDEDDDEEQDLSALFDNVEDEDEEDITDMFQQNEDGSLSFTNPETGLVETIEMLDEDDEGEDDEEEEIEESDDAEEFSLAETFDESSAAEDNSKPAVMTRYRNVRVNIGDQVDVFVKSHSPNQRQLFLTMDPTVKDLPKKARRQLDNVSKRTERLAKRLGGYTAIRKLRGMECEGVVKATSNMGDRRLYIQPNEDLPVGVATCAAELLDDLQQGDSVKVRLDGLDEQRGQLAMHVLERIDRSLVRTDTPLQP